jgi:hypothetical protein
MQTNPIHEEGQPLPAVSNADLLECTRMTAEQFDAALAKFAQSDGLVGPETEKGTTYVSYGLIAPTAELARGMMIDSIKWAIEQSGLGDKAVVVWRVKPTCEPHRNDAFRAGKAHVVRARFAVEASDAQPLG